MIDFGCILHYKIGAFPLLGTHPLRLSIFFVFYGLSNILKWFLYMFRFIVGRCQLSDSFNL